MAGIQWTSDEHEFVMKSHGKGMSVADIASKVGRSQSSKLVRDFSSWPSQNTKKVF